MLGVVNASIGQDTVGLLAWTARLAGDGPLAQVFDQREQLGDVVAVAASQ